MVARRTSEVDADLAEFRGQVLEFMRHQDEVNASFSHFLVNCFPHFVEAVGRLEGSVRWIMWGLGALVTIGLAAGVANVVSVFK